jgi:hypothetical protein
MPPLSLYDIWAPLDSIWSDWAKPVLFANLSNRHGSPTGPENVTPLVIHHLPPASGNMAVIVDLPGEKSVQAGMTLAGIGYRPVPLFNAAPPPGEVFTAAVVEVGRIRTALIDHAALLRTLPLPPEAPPCFLIDSWRRQGTGSANPGKFDNRWVTFPEDYPSANLLKSKGIQGIIVLQMEPGQPQEDLRHVLMRWQEAGLKIYLTTPDAQTTPTPATITKPSDFGSLWYRFLCVTGLRRNSAGGFGDVVPQPSQSSG